MSSSDDYSESSDSLDGNDVCLGSRLDDSDWENEDSAAGSKVNGGLTAVLDEELDFLSSSGRRRARARTAGSQPEEQESAQISLAFSGGGVRAAFFAAGVLWRLAEAGRLKHVEYISAVSGGTYAASALASYIIDEKEPGDIDIDTWYRQLIARMLCHMQNNTPYLARDLGKESQSKTLLPRLCDLPMLVCVVIATLLRAPVGILSLIVLPTVEMIEVVYGGAMRALFCADAFSNRYMMVSLLGKSAADLNVTVLFLMVFAAFVFRAMVAVLRSKTPRVEEELQGACVRHPVVFSSLFLQSLLSVAIRLLLGWVVLTCLIAGPVNWRFHRYSSVRGGTELRYCQCKHYIRDEPSLHCGELLLGAPGDEQWHQSWSRIYYNVSKGVPQHCTFDAEHSEYNDTSTQQLMEKANRWLFDRPLSHSMLPVAVLLTLLSQLLSLLLMPLFPDMFTSAFNICAPLLMFSVTMFLVQWRVLGPITGETFPGLTHAWWVALVKCAMVMNIVFVLATRWTRTIMHHYYSRSLHRAFYANGENCSWDDVRKNRFCPFLLFGATANDYMRPHDVEPLSEFTFSPLHEGGPRLGYFYCPGVRPLARTAALSGGAIDGFVLGVYDRLSFRFWLELFGVHMGDFIKFRVHRKESNKCFAAVYAWSVRSFFVVVYGLLLWGVHCASQHTTESCSKAKTLFICAISFASVLIIASFFDFLPFLNFLQDSFILRVIQQATLFFHRSPVPPTMLYVTDGGMLENTGILNLLRRKRRFIISVYAGEEEPGNAFACLKKVMNLMQDEGIGSLYDLEEPRRCVLEAIRLFSEERRMHLALGIYYFDDSEGILIVVKNHVPQSFEGSLPVRKLLTEDEILGREKAEEDKGFKGLQQTDLGGCLCDCCHRCCCNNCMGRFPAPPTANQFLTPQMMNSLCRLGYAMLPDEVFRHLDNQGQA